MKPKLIEVPLVSDLEAIIINEIRYSPHDWIEYAVTTKCHIVLFPKTRLKDFRLAMRGAAGLFIAKGQPEKFRPCKRIEFAACAAVLAREIEILEAQQKDAIAEAEAWAKPDPEF